MAYQNGHKAGNSESLQDRCFKMLVQPERVQYIVSDLGLPQSVHRSLVASQTQVRMERTDFEVPQHHSQQGAVVASLWRAHVSAIDEYSNPADISYGLGNQSSSSIGPSQNHMLIYCHSQSGCRVEGTFLVEYCAQRHMDLLLFDFPGCGQSPGEHVTLGWNEAACLSSVIEHVQQTMGVARHHIALWGRSMGAVAAMRFISHESAFLRMSGASISVLILDSPFADLMELARYTAQTKLNIPSFLLSVPLMILSGILKDRVGMDLLSFKPIDLVNSIVIPSLFLVAKDDKLLPKNTVQRLYSQCQSRMKQMEYCDGEHGSVRETDTVQRIFGFIDASMPGPATQLKLDSRDVFLDSTIAGTSSIQSNSGVNPLQMSLSSQRTGVVPTTTRRDAGFAQFDERRHSGNDKFAIRELQNTDGFNGIVNHQVPRGAVTRPTQHLRVTSDQRDTSLNRQSVYFDPFLREANKQQDLSKNFQRQTQEYSATLPQAENRPTQPMSRPNTRLDFRGAEVPRVGPSTVPDILSSSMLGSSGHRETSFIQDQSNSIVTNGRSDMDSSIMQRGTHVQKRMNPLLKSFNQQPMEDIQQRINDRLVESPILYKNGLGSASAVNLRQPAMRSYQLEDQSTNKFRDFIQDVHRQPVRDSSNIPLRPTVQQRIHNHQEESTSRIIGFGNSGQFGPGPVYEAPGQGHRQPTPGFGEARHNHSQHHQHMNSFSESSIQNHFGDTSQINASGSVQNGGGASFTQNMMMGSQGGPRLNPGFIKSIHEPTNEATPHLPQRYQSPVTSQTRFADQAKHGVGFRSFDSSSVLLRKPQLGGTTIQRPTRGGQFFNSVDLSMPKDLNHSLQQMNTLPPSNPPFVLENPLLMSLGKSTTDRPHSSLMDVFQNRRPRPEEEVQKQRVNTYEGNRDPYMLYASESRQQTYNPADKQAGTYSTTFAPSLRQPETRQPHKQSNSPFEQPSIESVLQNAGLPQPNHTLGSLSVNNLSEFRGAPQSLVPSSKPTISRATVQFAPADTDRASKEVRAPFYRHPGASNLLATSRLNPLSTSMMR